MRNHIKYNHKIRVLNFYCIVMKLTLYIRLFQMHENIVKHSSKILAIVEAKWKTEIQSTIYISRYNLIHST